jgi:hypothetical protein
VLATVTRFDHVKPLDDAPEVSIGIADAATKEEVARCRAIEQRTERLGGVVTGCRFGTYS